MIFLIQSPHGWRDLWQRPHHLATRFARAGHRVYWVEPRYVRWLLDDAPRFNRARTERISDFPDGGFIDVRPVTLLNGERLAPIRRWNQFRLSHALASAAQSSNHSAAQSSPNSSPPGAKSAPHNSTDSTPAEPRVLWLYNPHESHLADSVPHDLLIYDIMDEYQGFPWSPPAVAAEEARLLRDADWVFAGTEALHQSKKRLRGDRGIECILSGVDARHFASARKSSPTSAAASTDSPQTSAADPAPPTDPAPSTDPPGLFDLRARYRKLIGYAGMIDLRIDQPLLAEAARNHPDWAFILLGARRCDTSALHDEPNIHLLGPRDYAELPAWYAAWDAAILPFVENDLTRHVNPTKMLEYAAADLPIAARALPDVERFYARGAWLYRTPEEFDAALVSALGLSENDDDDAEALNKRRQMQAWLNERSWDAIARRMLDRLAELTATPRP